MSLDPNTAHVEEAIALLTSMFRGKPITEALLTSVVNRVQDLENVVQDILALRYLDDATGAQLDDIGGIVTEARDSRSDGEYRESIRVRIFANRSQGRIEDVIGLVSLLLNTDPFEVTEPSPAFTSVEAYDISVDRVKAMMKFLPKVRAVGTRLDLSYSTWVNSKTIKWGSTVGVASFRGFGSSVGGTGDHFPVSVQRMK